MGKRGPQRGLYVRKTAFVSLQGKKNIFTNTDLEILTVKMHYFVSPHSIVNGR